MDKKVFKAQALAIVMLILVVSSIIGVSLFSRMSKDKDASVSEQDSSIAAAQVDAILDFFIGADIEMIEGVLGEEARGFNNVPDLVDFLVNNNIITSPPDSGMEEDWCIVSTDEQLKVTIDFADEGDTVEAQPGSVIDYNLEDIEFDPAASCPLTLYLQSIDTNSVFMVKWIKNDGSEVSELKENYCITETPGGACTGDLENVHPMESLSSIVTTGGDGNSFYTVTFDLYDLYTNQNVVEIRVLPIEGALLFYNNQPSCVSNKNFIPIKIFAQATCNSKTRGSEMFLPGSGMLGYSTLFDYGIYDNGYFQP